MRILLTGASGFVGRWLVPSLHRRFPDAEITDLSLRGGSEGSPCKHITADIADLHRLSAAFVKIRPNLVVHLAAQSSVARSQSDATSTWTTNVSGSLNLALAIEKYAPDATVLFVSTGEVYGQSFLTGRVHENSPILPLNVYSKSKALAEQAFTQILPPSAQLIIARPLNHTGPGQSPDFVLPSFARQIAQMEAGQRLPVMEVGNLDVQRDFLDVRDVVNAYLMLIEKARALPRRLTVNISSGGAWPLRELLERLRSLARVPFKIVTDPKRLRPVDLPVTSADSTLLTTLTDWRIQYPIEKTLSDLLDSFRIGASK